jgi:hypothetical protein
MSSFSKHADKSLVTFLTKTLAILDVKIILFRTHFTRKLYLGIKQGR